MGSDSQSLNLITLAVGSPLPLLSLGAGHLGDRQTTSTSSTPGPRPPELSVWLQVLGLKVSFSLEER